MPARLTEPDVTHAFQRVKEYFADDITDSITPKLLRDWDWLDSGPTPWAIVWEEGPDDWAVQFSHADMIDPARVFTEPVTGWALALYRP